MREEDGACMCHAVVVRVGGGATRREREQKSKWCDLRRLEEAGHALTISG